MVGSGNTPNSVQRYLDQFDQLWHEGRIPSIESMLSECDFVDEHDRSALLIECVMIDLEYRWRNASRVAQSTSDAAQVVLDKELPCRPLLEDYVNRYPALGPLEELPLELIKEEYVTRHRWGDRPDLSEYQQRFLKRTREIVSSLRKPKVAHSEHTAASENNVRCPHCQNSVSVQKGSSVVDVYCPRCGNRFSLLDDDTATVRWDRKLFAHFELLDRVGAGSFGAVWKARDTKLDRIVAVKIPREDRIEPAEAESFLREARAAAQLRHPNIVAVHEVGHDQSTTYIVSDYIEGITLADKIGVQRFSCREATRLTVVLADAVQHAHSRGVFHRDLKPGNIMLDANDEPHVMDFGLARRDSVDVTMTFDGKLLGTPAYMSPEQAKGESHSADARSDVYSLGVILFELLTGEKPFRGSISMMLYSVIHLEAPSPRTLNKHVPKDLETICQTCLEKTPRRRYATAKQFSEELQRYLRGEPIKSRPISRATSAIRWCRRHPTLSVVIALVLLIAISGPLAALKFFDQADRYRRLLYAADMNVAQTAWENADVDSVLAALRRHVPRGQQHDLRGFEWFYLWGLCEPSVHAPTLSHNGTVNALDVSPDGSTIATAPPGTVVLWDSITGKRLHTLNNLYRHTGSDLEFSPDGRVLGISGYDGTYLLWDWQERGAPLLLSQAATPGKNCIAFQPPHGNHVVVEGSDDGVLKVWNVRDNVWESQVRGEFFGVRSIRFSADGSTLFVAGLDKQVTKISFSDRQKLKTCSVAHAVNCINVEPVEGGTLAVGLWNGDIEIRDADTLELLTRWSGHKEPVSAVEFLADASTLASASWDGSLTFWNVEGRKKVRTYLGHSGSVTDTALSPDGRFVTSSGARGSVRLWSCDQFLASKPSTDTANSMASSALSPAVNWYLSGHKAIYAWDFNLNQEVPMWPVPNATFATCSLQRDRIAVGRRNGVVEILNLATDNGVTNYLEGQALPEAHRDAVEFLLFSSDGHTLVTGAGGYELKLWDVRNNELVDTLPVHRGNPPPFVYPVAISPTGKTLAAAETNDEGQISIALWETSDGTKKTTFASELTPITSLAFANELILACGQSDGSIVLWNTGTGKLQRELRGHSGVVFSLSFSPDGARLASGSADRTVKVWDATTGSVLLSFDVAGSGSSVAFTADGSALAYSDADSNVGLWRAADRPLRDLSKP